MCFISLSRIYLQMQFVHITGLRFVELCDESNSAGCVDWIKAELQIKWSTIFIILIGYEIYRRVEGCRDSVRLVIRVP